MREGGAPVMDDYPSILTPEDLANMPGAPFATDVVAAAESAVRHEAGWHIAPQVTETLTLDSDGGQVLILPTLRLTAVSEVRDVTGESPTVLDGWRMSKRASALFRRSGWPCGFEAVEIDLTHGYDFFPPSLLPVLADRAQRRVRQQSAGSFSMTFASSSDEGDQIGTALAKFKLPPRP